MKFLSQVLIKDRKINEWLSMVEKEMRMTLARLLAAAVSDVNQFKSTTIDQSAYLNWVDQYQAQLVVLAAQIAWSESVDSSLHAIEKVGGKSLDPLITVLQTVESTLSVLANCVLHDQPPVRRRKLEHLVSKKHTSVVPSWRFMPPVSSISHEAREFLFLAR